MEVVDAEAFLGPICEAAWFRIAQFGRKTTVDDAREAAKAKFKVRVTPAPQGAPSNPRPAASEIGRERRDST